MRADVVAKLDPDCLAGNGRPFRIDDSGIIAKIEAGISLDRAIVREGHIMCGSAVEARVRHHNLAVIDDGDPVAANPKAVAAGQLGSRSEMDRSVIGFTVNGGINPVRLTVDLDGVALIVTADMDAVSLAVG